MLHSLCNRHSPIGSVIFVDTENTFRSERVHQIAENRGINPDRILQKVFVCKVLNAAHLEMVAQIWESRYKNITQNWL